MSADATTQKPTDRLGNELPPARQLALLIGDDSARAAITAGWDALRPSIAAGHITPGIGDYVATVAILAYIEQAAPASNELAEARAELAKWQRVASDIEMAYTALKAETPTEYEYGVHWPADEFDEQPNEVTVFYESRALAEQWISDRQAGSLVRRAVGTPELVAPAVTRNSDDLASPTQTITTSEVL